MISLHPRQEQSWSQCKGQLGAFGPFLHRHAGWSDSCGMCPLETGLGLSSPISSTKWARKYPRGQHQPLTVSSSSQQNKKDQFFWLFSYSKVAEYHQCWNLRLLNKIGTWGQWKIGTKRDLLDLIVQSPAAWGSCGKELPHFCIETCWGFCPHKISCKSIPEMHFLDSQVLLLISSWNVFLANL